MSGPDRLAAPFLLAALLALSACDSAKERAEAHYQRASTLLEEGDTARAIVEFRNVFRLDGNHSAARRDYANLMVEEGRLEEAIGQFLRLVEQDWSNVDGHKRLAELALSVQDFETARTHADRAYDLDPTDPEIRAFKASVDFRDGETEAATEMAEGVLADRPDNLTAQMVLIAERMRAEDINGALARIETALEGAPADEALNLVKLAVLEQRGDRAAVGAHLVRMRALFPENGSVTEALITWHLQTGDIDAAEPLLRIRAEAETPGTQARVAADLALVQALFATRGPEAARAELDRLAAAAEDATPYARTRAELDVGTGRAEEGIAALRALIAEGTPSDTRRDTQIILARILAARGDAEDSAELVDAVLTEDALHVAALKMRAQRLIDTDRPEAAIRDLRNALNQEPRDPEALTLMAAAHEREGARELAGERLAMAVEASGRAPEESIRYARFLLQDDRADPAQAVIVEALRRRPGDPDLLTALGEIHLSEQAWGRAQETVAALRALDAPEAAARATALEAQILSGQRRFSETIDLLEGLSEAPGGNRAALSGIVQTYARAGDFDGARTYLEGVRRSDPDAPLPRLMLAGLSALEGAAEDAEDAYRALIADRPDYAPAYEGLYLVLAGTGQNEAAAEILEAGLAATGDAARLRFIDAGRREAEGDFEGAIEVYESLYAEDSSAPLIANNLASLLSSHRSDPESQERAFAIARRLRSTDVPHFQDTYGWILARRGAHEEALPHLERAAAGLPEEPLVRYHLGATQYHLGQPEAARANLEQALALAGPATPEAAMAEARALLEEIARAADAAGSETGAEPGGEATSGQ